MHNTNWNPQTIFPLCDNSVVSTHFDSPACAHMYSDGASQFGKEHRDFSRPHDGSAFSFCEPRNSMLDRLPVNNHANLNLYGSGNTPNQSYCCYDGCDNFNKSCEDPTSWCGTSQSKCEGCGGHWCDFVPPPSKGDDPGPPPSKGDDPGPPPSKGDVPAPPAAFTPVIVDWNPLVQAQCDVLSTPKPIHRTGRYTDKAACFDAMTQLASGDPSWYAKWEEDTWSCSYYRTDDTPVLFNSGGDKVSELLLHGDNVEAAVSADCTVDGKDMCTMMWQMAQKDLGPHSLEALTGLGQTSPSCLYKLNSVLSNDTELAEEGCTMGPGVMCGGPKDRIPWWPRCMQDNYTKHFSCQLENNVKHTCIGDDSKCNPPNVPPSEWQFFCSDDGHHCMIDGMPEHRDKILANRCENPPPNDPIAGDTKHRVKAVKGSWSGGHCHCGKSETNPYAFRTLVQNPRYDIDWSRPLDPYGSDDRTHNAGCDSYDSSLCIRDGIAADEPCSDIAHFAEYCQELTFEEGAHFDAKTPTKICNVPCGYGKCYNTLGPVCMKGWTEESYCTEPSGHHPDPPATTYKYECRGADTLTPGYPYRCESNGPDGGHSTCTATTLYDSAWDVMLHDPACRGVCKAKQTNDNCWDWVTNPSNPDLEYKKCGDLLNCTGIESSACGPGMKPVITHAIGCKEKSSSVVEFDATKAACECVPLGIKEYIGKYPDHQGTCQSGDDCLGNTCEPPDCIQDDVDGRIRAEQDVTACKTAYLEGDICKTWKRTEGGVECGFKDQPCCNTGISEACFKETVCVDKKCEQCGGLGQPCCAGDKCSKEASQCHNGTCQIPCHCKCKCHRTGLNCYPNDHAEMSGCPSGYKAVQTDTACNKKHDYCHLTMGFGDCEHEQRNQAPCTCSCVKDS